MTLLRRLGALAFGVAAAAVVLEATLQGASFVFWLRSQPSEERGAGRAEADRLVLCVGDSFTYGIGASSSEQAYPARLEAALGTRAVGSGSWRVVNGGWPGRNSAEVVQRLPGQLGSTRADYVCVLVGANNAWSSAEMDLPLPRPGVDRSEDGRSAHWTWRFRTGRLAKLVAATVAGRPPARLAPDGAPEGEQDAGEGGGKSREDAPATVCTRTPVVDPLSAEERRVADLDWEAARAAIERIWEGFEALRAGDDGVFLATVDESRARIDELADPRVAAALVEALGYGGRDREAVEVGMAALERHGYTADLYLHLVRPLARLGRMSEAQAMAGRALELRPHDARMHRAAAFLHAMGGDEAAFAEVARAYRLDGDRSRAEVEVRLALQQVPTARERFAAVVRDSGVGPEDAAALLALFDGLRFGEEARRARLRQDLLHIRDLAAASGAQAVLLTYPKPYSGENSTIATILDVAESADIPLVDLGPVFAKLIEEHSEEALYVSDGHLTDLGYQEMTAAVADRLIEIEGERPMREQSYDHGGEGRDRGAERVKTVVAAPPAGAVALRGVAPRDGSWWNPPARVEQPGRTSST